MELVALAALHLQLPTCNRGDHEFGSSYAGLGTERPTTIRVIAPLLLCAGRVPTLPWAQPCPVV